MDTHRTERRHRRPPPILPACAIVVAASLSLGPGFAQEPVIRTEQPVASTEFPLTFTTWTGPYMRSQMLGFVRPYEEQTGSRVKVEHYAGGLNHLRDQVESANVTWDVVDLTQADLLRACEEGLLEKIPDITLPAGADGTPFRDDFVEGGLHECGVGVIVWATAYAFDREKFGADPPTTIADFFDTKKFPGPRAVRNDPTVTMEWALIADGARPEEVTALLETPAGIKRALAKMEAIRPGLKVWSNGREPVRLLNSGDIAMSSIWATTGAAATLEPGARFDLVWDGKVLELDLFAIPKGSRNRQAAIDFIRFASSAQSLAKMVEHLPNGPARQSSLALVADDIKAQLPNNPARENELTIQSDAAWWSRNHAALEEVFRAWLDGPVQKGPAGTVR